MNRNSWNVCCSLPMLIYWSRQPPTTTNIILTQLWRTSFQEWHFLFHVLIISRSNICIMNVILYSSSTEKRKQKHRRYLIASLQLPNWHRKYWNKNLILYFEQREKERKELMPIDVWYKFIHRSRQLLYVCLYLYVCKLHEWSVNHIPFSFYRLQIE